MINININISINISISLNTNTNEKITVNRGHATEDWSRIKARGGIKNGSRKWTVKWRHTTDSSSTVIIGVIAHTPGRVSKRVLHNKT